MKEVDRKKEKEKKETEVGRERGGNSTQKELVNS